ncbi:hypothetical protein D3C86_1861900 [compost metagenome]
MLLKHEQADESSASKECEAADPLLETGSPSYDRLIIHAGKSAEAEHRRVAKE